MAEPNLYARMRVRGVQSVSDAELLAEVLGGRRSRRGLLAERILSEAHGLWGLRKVGMRGLLDLGLGRAPAARLVACFELGRRAAVEPPTADAVREPQDAYRCVAGLFAGAERERFVVVVLDVKSRPCHVATVSEGSVDTCPVDPREVFAPALRERGSAILVAHNHPSGDLSPSKEDVRLTERLVQAGSTLGMPVLDHLIVGPCGDVPRWVSLAECGLVPPASRWARPRRP